MLDSKAYTEVYYIIHSMSDELRNKIPEEIQKNIESRMDKDYEFYVEEDINKMDLLEDTEKILSVLYTDYFSTEEERKVIFAKEKSILYNNELEKQKKYNPNNLFNKNDEINEEKKEITKYQKQPLYKRIFEKIKDFFKR